LQTPCAWTTRTDHDEICVDSINYNDFSHTCFTKSDLRNL